MTRQEERLRDWKTRELKATQLSKWMSDSAIQYPLNIRVDLTLKQRIDSELETRRSSHSPTVRYSTLTYRDTFIPALDAVVPVKTCHIERLDDRNTVNVAVKQGRVSLKDAALRTPFYYLTDYEARKLPARIVNGLNRQLFGQRARRANNPERLSALIAKHDKGTRQHLHCLFGIPASVSLPDFSNALRRVLNKEQFAYHIMNIEHIQSLHRSLWYNVNDDKSLMEDALVYMYPIPRPFPKEEFDNDDQLT